MIWRCDLIPQYEAYKNEIEEAIKRVLGSGRYILGHEVEQFEKEFSEYLGIKHAVGVANATDGLFISLKLFDVGEGDEIITTPFTAIPTISAIIAAGAKPVFVDIDLDTFLMDINQVESAITPKTKAIIPVHIFGNVFDVKKLKKLVDKIPIIEDAAQAHGSEIHGKKAGTMGDIGVFSFYPTKNLGGYGDGGMIVTNNPELAKKAKLLRNYGMVNYHTVVINGYNSRLDEIQAAILRVKLKYLNEMNKKRNQIAKRYIKALNKDYFIHQAITSGAYSNYHVFVSRFKKKRNELIKFLDKNGIQTNIYYRKPVYMQKAYKFLGIKKGMYPKVEKLCKEVIALPMYPEFSIEKQNYVIEKINEYLQK